MTALAFVNPSSGNADPEQVEQQLRARLPALETRRTPEERDLVVYAREQIAVLRPDLVIVSGGDGTISAVASALEGAELPLAIVPTGTANLLARELQIPLDVPSACDVLAQRRTHAIDAMLIGTRRCLCRLGCGHVAEVGAETTAEQKQQDKGLAYIRAALPRLISPEELDFELEIDDETYQLHASSVVVTNVNVVGMAELAWGAAVCPDDGFIDVIVLRAYGLADHIELLWGAMGGEAAEVGVANHFRARRSVSIRSGSDITTVADGEPLTGRSHRISVHPSSVYLCVPS